ncbi:alkaline phosphatase family protein [Halegenticoccus soli]|uniref:hypothetical protein n=1 Tax=Halegenticoccus soli TaxID=1985678 RepID=UPI000C6CFEE9|nr:hypothetical protein [Halegenticoccus soli]
MTFADWLAETRLRFDQEGLAAARPALSELYMGAWSRVGRAYNYGTPVWEREWDLLVILDACRVDLLRAVEGEYAFVDGALGTLDSVGSMSAEWLEKTFAPEYADEMRRTAYVTGNPFTERVGLDPNDFAALDEVWAYAWDEEARTIRPRPLTDRTIARCRGERPDRVIVHYMQPHAPFLSDPSLGTDLGTPDDGFGEVTETKTVWQRLRDGEVDRGRVWNAYLDNLRIVLDDVALLLSNVDAGRAAITADHANAMGELGIWGHPDHVPLRAVKRVPWVVTSATDRGTHEPADWRPDEGGERTIEQRLSDLGYVDGKTDGGARGGANR